MAGKSGKCPACGEKVWIAASSAPVQPTVMNDSEPPEQIELALLQLRRLHAAARGPSPLASIGAPVGFGCLGGLVTMFVTAGICVAVIGTETLDKTKSPVPGLIGMTSGLLAMGAIVVLVRARRRRRTEEATRNAQAAVATAVDDLIQHFPTWAKRIGGPAAIQTEEAVNDALSMLRRSGRGATALPAASGRATGGADRMIRGKLLFIGPLRLDIVVVWTIDGYLFFQKPAGWPLFWAIIAYMTLFFLFAPVAILLIPLHIFIFVVCVVLPLWGRPKAKRIWASLSAGDVDAAMQQQKHYRAKPFSKVKRIAFDEAACILSIDEKRIVCAESDKENCHAFVAAVQQSG